MSCSTVEGPIPTNAIAPGPTDTELFRSLPEYLWRSGTTNVRIFTINRPLRFFGFVGLALMTPGVLLGLLLKSQQGHDHLANLFLPGIPVAYHSLFLAPRHQWLLRPWGEWYAYRARALRCLLAPIRPLHPTPWRP